MAYKIKATNWGKRVREYFDVFVECSSSRRQNNLRQWEDREYSILMTKENDVQLRLLLNKIDMQTLINGLQYTLTQGIFYDKEEDKDVK